MLCVLYHQKIHKAVQEAFWSILGRLGEGVGFPKLRPSTKVNRPSDGGLGPYSQTRFLLD